MARATEPTQGIVCHHIGSVMTFTKARHASLWAFGVAAPASIVAGLAVGTRHGVLVAGFAVIFFLLGTAVLIFVRDPVQAFLYLWVIEIINGPVSAIFGYYSTTGQAIRQTDEVCVVLFVIGLAARLIWLGTRQLSPVVIQLVWVAALILACGLTGAVLNSVPITVTVVGAWLASKLWIALLIGLLLPWKRADPERVYRFMTRIGVVIAVFGLVDYAAHGAISSFLHISNYEFSSQAFRGESVHSIFPHPGQFSLFMCILFAVTLSRYASQRTLADLMYALGFALAALLSLRLKGVLALTLVTLSIGLMQTLSTRGPRNWSVAFVGVLIISLAFVMESSVLTRQVGTYTGSTVSPRARLYNTGFEIAEDKFPFGVGFGRFATYQSRTHYSPVYAEYGLNNIWGLSKRVPTFIDDTSWPGILGETGWAGFVIYLTGLGIVFRLLIRTYRSTGPDLSWLPLAALTALIALLVDSIGDPTLFDWIPTTAVGLLVGAALMLTRPKGNEEDVLPASRLAPAQAEV